MIKLVEISFTTEISKDGKINQLIPFKKSLLHFLKNPKQGNIDIKMNLRVLNSERLMESNSDNGQLTFF